MFNEYDFLDFCEDKYLDGLGQDDAHKLVESGELTQVVKDLPSWQLVVCLGEYLQRRE